MSQSRAYLMGWVSNRKCSRRPALPAPSRKLETPAELGYSLLRFTMYPPATAGEYKMTVPVEAPSDNRMSG